MPETMLLLTIAAVVIVLAFDYTNGFHDAANIIATVIASRAMRPLEAVLVVGVFEFLGPLLGGTAVANTIGGFVELEGMSAAHGMSVVLCALGGAIAWNLLTWLKGIPSSSSHALVGGLIGAVTIAAGADHVVWGFRQLAHGELTGVTKVLLGLMLSPLAGFLAGYLLQRLAALLTRAARPSLNRSLRRTQYLTAAGLAFSHGTNDAQKSMGLLTLALLLGGHLERFVVPGWVMIACATAMTLGTLTGGWRIVRTLGFAIYRVRPLHALDSQLASAATVLGASLAGAPVSTTHVVATSIMGVGAAEHPRAVRWGKAGEIATTWIITIPAAASLAATGQFLVQSLVR
ncbi:inorganic phosphate transporter [Cognatazoarcus halotolerans]|uniref:inorganic phosphate transporter n=1 Tax=Cognatazoarcus halotolerans TaxID=2686016 RepID=UPI00135BF5C3|nr:inorganic phosphate transporter [Cognatazoarcus halotolerans]MCB1898258.1 inorganic phosphate transporter [Rhodocyclaceae bacterium]MCP5310314.1 inorganic phosphate transporter [Zoogloeaceae bacterium]